jgi:hypothetical protein
MRTQWRKPIPPKSEEKLQGIGLLVYGAMMLGGGLTAPRQPELLAVAALGLIALIIGLQTLARPALREHAARKLFRDNKPKPYSPMRRWPHQPRTFAVTGSRRNPDRN